MTQQAFWNWFYNSALVLWSRLQVLLGSIVAVLLITDMTPWLPAKYLAIWIPINGVISEYLRRTNTETRNIIVSTPQGVMSDVTYLKPPDPVPEGTKLVAVKKMETLDINRGDGYSGYVVFGMVMILSAALFGMFALVNEIFK